MDEEHRGGVEVERELRSQDGRVVISSARVRALKSVGQGICRVYSYTPLYLAGDFVDIIDRIIRLVP